MVAVIGDNHHRDRPVFFSWLCCHVCGYIYCLIDLHKIVAAAVYTVIEALLENCCKCYRSLSNELNIHTEEMEHDKKTHKRNFH